MEHKLINGGEEWLPFARSRIKALRATGLEYASQKFEVDGCSVRVQLVGEQEFIWIDEAPQFVWAFPFASFPVNPMPDGTGGYIKPKPLLNDALGSLVLGSHAIPDGSSNNPPQKALQTWGNSPFSRRNIVSVLDPDGRARVPTEVFSGADMAFSYPGEFTRAPTSFKDSGYLPIEQGANPTDSPLIIMAKYDTSGSISGVITGISGSMEIFLFRPATAEGGINQPGGPVAQVTKAESLLLEGIAGSMQFAEAVGWGAKPNLRSAETDSYSKSVYAISPSGSVYLAVQRIKEKVIAQAEYDNADPPNPIKFISTAKGTVSTTLYKTSVTGKKLSKIAVYPLDYSASRTYINISDDASTYVGSPKRVIGIIPGGSQIGVLYQDARAAIGAGGGYTLDLVKASDGEIVRTIGVPLWPGTFFTSKLEGCVGIVAGYSWGTGFCLNTKTEAFLEIPGSLKPSTALTVPGAIFGTCDYLLVSKDGKKATYYWLNISEAKRPFVTSGGNAYPLKDGHLRSYEIKEIAGVETVVDVSPSPNTKIIGTNKILIGDTNGAALLFKKGGGK